MFPPDVTPDIWAGSKDLSADVFLGWDEDYFYLAVAVTDDSHFNKQKGVDIWNGDCVQFALDTMADADITVDKWKGYNQNDYEIGLAKTEQGVQCYQWSPKMINLKKSQVAISRKGTLTTYEAAIPFSAIRPAEGKAGSIFGFNIVIFDDYSGSGQSYYYQLTPRIAGGKAPWHFRKIVLTLD